VETRRTAHGAGGGWSLVRPVARKTEPVWAPSSSSSRAHVPGTFTVRGRLTVADGLDGELARLQDPRHRRDGPSCQGGAR
jgi:hypothetical protein